MSLIPTELKRRILIRRAAVAACLVLIAWPAWAADDQTSGAVTGRVLSFSGSRVVGVPGVSVRLVGLAVEEEHATSSGEGGAFAFTGLAPGQYVLEVLGSDRDERSIEVEVLPGRESEVEVDIGPRFEGAVSVTATRTARRTEKIPASVTVIGEDLIEQTPMANIRDAIAGTPGTLIESKNQGYDARLIIRGAGLKARYGIREIMVLLNGIPITDPDSFTRLDFVDTYMVESIEVVRGPNSTLWGVNATGGAINVITRSPFDGRGGVARVDVGSYGTLNGQVGYSGGMGEGNAFNLNVSRRQSSNDWREHNDFDTTQFTFQPCFTLSDDTVWENFISYTDANLLLPGRLIQSPYSGIDQWTPYMETGEVQVTAEPWKDSARFSEILFFGSRLVTRVGAVDLKPQIFVNSWTHDHPVTGRINDSDTLDAGLDLQADYAHGAGLLTGGFTLRYADQDSEAYEYADVATTPSGRILSTLSDRRGDLMERQNRKTVLAGLYVQESLHIGDRWLVDMGVRYDRINLDITGYEWTAYDYSGGQYVPGEGEIDSSRTFTVLSPRVAAVFELSPTLNGYGSISTGSQTPTADELTLNPDLNLTTVVSYELGLKSRHRAFSLDMAIYFNPVEDEVVQVSEGHGETSYTNAGKTEKKGAELAVVYAPGAGVTVGGSYSYTDYTFKEFSEPVRGQDVDRSGNYLPYVPTHQYSLFVGWAHHSGFSARASATSWGEYFMDNANTEKYQGYSFATDLNLAYAIKSFEIAVFVQNLFGKRYAVEAQKDLYGSKRYSPAAPRSVLARLTYRFGS